MFKTILIPVDITEPDLAKRAFEHGVDLAHAARGKIRLIYVRSLMPVTFMEYVPPSFDQEQQKECEAALDKLRHAIPLPEDRVSAIVRMGSVYNEVLAEAKECKADVIILGSHRPSMASYLLGSNATTIVRHAPCSVLVIRET
jgi:universal stress protein F